MLEKELLAACKTAAEQIRRCDYTPARSTLLSAIKKAEYAMTEGKPDADGWIKWGGGKRPVDADALVDCKLRGGYVEGCQKASFFDWSHIDDDTDNDIIAYRIVEGD